MAVQSPLFPPASAWRPPDLSTLPAWPRTGRVCVDVETHDPQLKELGPGVRRGGYIAGVNVGIEDGPAFYLPLRHPEDNVSDPAQALTYLRDNMRVFEGTVVGAHLGYDLDYLWEAGLHFSPTAKYSDVLILEPLLDELSTEGYSLDKVCKRRGLPGKDTAVLEEAARAYGQKSARAGIAQLPARYVGAYGEADARMPLLLLRRQERELEEQPGVEKVWELERRVLPALVRIRRRGVRVDFDRLGKIEELMMQREREALDELHRVTGVRVNVGDVWRAEALAKALEADGTRLPRTAQGKPSVTKEVLASIKSPAGAAIASARKANKIRTTFAASVRSYAVNGRIHCTLNQMFGEEDDGEERGAAWGRMSAQDPNLQQQPARDPELGPMWRGIYLPEEGEEWCSVDYSQQEPRMAVHYAVLAQLPWRRVGGEFVDPNLSANTAARYYRDDPGADFHQMMSDMTKLRRRDAKEVFLGLIYGMGGAKFCRKVGLPTAMITDERTKKTYEGAGPEGQALLDQFDAKVPWVRSLADACKDAARKKGYVRTLYGRRCRFPRKPDGSIDWVHKALNRVIQGGSGDQTKAAVVAADEENLPVNLQVHDELTASVPTRAVGHRLAHVMEHVVELQVPAKAEAKFGPSWGEAK